jgi:Ca2+-binding RTX toxin-like protein
MTVFIGSNLNDTADSTIPALAGFLTGLPADLTDGVADTFFGNGGDDFILAGFTNDVLHGGVGNDNLNGGFGNDVVLGEAGNDMLFGGFGFDMLNGGADNDVMYGGAQVDDLRGEAGNDIARIMNGEAADNYNGGTETDLIDMSAVVGFNAFVTLIGGSYNIGAMGAAVLLDVENVYGTQQGDTIFGSNVANLIRGFGGNDFVSSLDGNDLLAGMNGNDNLQAGAGDDTADGGNGNDGIMGQDGNDKLFGGAGVDTVNGGNGNDVVNGGLANDTLIGGPGFDTFVFDTPLAGNLDTIDDFSSFFDTIQLDDAVFSALPVGALAAAAFQPVPFAVDLDDRIMYDFGTGFISYDPTGSLFGAADQVTFARVDPGTAVNFTDFVVV